MVPNNDDAPSFSRADRMLQNMVRKNKQALNQLTKFKEEYKTLQQTLSTLTDKVSHEIMVPIGDVAFMPGKITHTNEVMVLLGENYFALRSAKQAYLDESIAELQQEALHLQAKAGLASELSAASKTMKGENIVDIREDIKGDDDPKEKRRQKRRAAAIIPTGQLIPQTQKTNNTTANTEEDDEIMEKLKRLEMMEEQAALQEIHQPTSETAIKTTLPKAKITTPDPHLQQFKATKAAAPKHVTFASDLDTPVVAGPSKTPQPTPTAKTKPPTTQTFFGEVKERDVITPDEDNAPPPDQPKRVSKFKAARMGQQ